MKMNNALLNIVQATQAWGQQFTQLQGRHPGLWPVAPRVTLLAALLFGVITAGAWLCWIDQWELLDRTRAEEGELRKLFRHKVGQVQNLEALRQKKAAVSDRVEILSRQLPGKSEMDALLSEINQAGAGRGLQFELFKPEQLRLRPYYAELPIAIKLVGNYHALAGFVSDIANLPRVVTIDHLVINQQKEGVQIFEAIVHTYRYLDKEEASDQAKRLLTSQKKLNEK
jgi:type IV pilus assembly protein PilO